MLRLGWSAGVLQCQQVMPALYFLQEHDVSRHAGQRLLDTMHTRPRGDGADAFVNIPGGDA